MARLKGITIEIGADTKGLDKALSGVNKRARDSAVELRQVERLLKLDPKSTELVAQKQTLLASRISATRDKLDVLRAAEKQVSEQFAKGDIKEQQYREFRRELVKTEAELSQLQSTAKQGPGIFGKLKASLNTNIGDIQAKWIAVSAAAAATWRVMRAGMQAASGLAEAQSKVAVVFGDSSSTVLKWAKDSDMAMGMSERAALEAAGTYGNLFSAIGLTEGASSGMSTTLVQLASDLASFNNVSDTQEVFDALRSGLTGETEPLRKFGVNLNDSRLQEEALRLGLVKTTKGVLPASAKAQAAYSLILKDTTLAQGDYARTADGLANSERTLAAAQENLTASVGQFSVESLGLPETFQIWAQSLDAINRKDWKTFFDLMVESEDEIKQRAIDAAKAAQDQASITDALGQSTGETAADTGALGSSMQQAGAATQSLTRDIHGLLVAQDSLSGKTRSAKDAELAWRDAIIASRAADAEVATLRKEGKTGTDEYRSAVIAAERAELALSDAKNASLEAQHAVNVELVKAAAGTSTLSGDTATLAGDLNTATDRVAGLKAKLDTVPKSKRAKVEADIKDAEANVRTIKRKIEELRGRTIPVKVQFTGNGTIKRAIVDGKLTGFTVNAAGGVYDRPTAALIGETYEKEYVINADRLRRGDPRQMDLLSGLIRDTGTNGRTQPGTGSGRDGARIIEQIFQVPVPSYSEVKRAARDGLEEMAW